MDDLSVVQRLDRRYTTGMRSALLLLSVAAVAGAQDFYRISNGKISVAVMKQGGAITSITLDNDALHRNPLWEPAAGSFGASRGHFLCVDGFGGVSAEEKAAGFPSHGEAYLKAFAGTSSGAEMHLATSLPLAHETVARNLVLLPGRSVLQVDTQLTNELSFDRPAQWAEHATIGSPFLEPGATVIDMRAVKAKTRPYIAPSGGLPHRLPSGQDFTWPLAPSVSGGTLEMRLTPGTPNSGDHTTSLMDPSREWAWVTALNTKQHLMIGYLFRREEFPWIQSWEYYPPSGVLARGLEFSTQPFDVPRRQVVTENSLFGAPTYRWLPAKSSISARFYVFVTEVPENWQKVDDVVLEGNKITVKAAQGSLTL